MNYAHFSEKMGGYMKRERERERTSPNMQLQQRKVSEDGFIQYNTHEKYIIIHCL